MRYVDNGLTLMRLINEIHNGNDKIGFYSEDMVD